MKQLMRKIVLISFVVVLVLGVTGCSASKMAEVSKKSKINEVKTNQEIVAKLIESYYVTYRQIPEVSDIEERSVKSMEEMNLKVTYNGDKTFTIKSTHPDLTEQDVPSKIVDLNEK